MHRFAIDFGFIQREDIGDEYYEIRRRTDEKIDIAWEIFQFFELDYPDLIEGSITYYNLGEWVHYRTNNSKKNKKE